MMRIGQALDLGLHFFCLISVTLGPHQPSQSLLETRNVLHSLLLFGGGGWGEVGATLLQPGEGNVTTLT